MTFRICGLEEIHFVFSLLPGALGEEESLKNRGYAVLHTLTPVVDSSPHLFTGYFDWLLGLC